MAKKLNSFAADFEGLNKSADDKVLAILKSAERTNEAPTKTAADVKPKKPKAETEIEQTKTENPKAKVIKTERSKNTKPSSPAEWGNPSHISTVEFLGRWLNCSMISFTNSERRASKRLNKTWLWKRFTIYSANTPFVE